MPLQSELSSHPHVLTIPPEGLQSWPELSIVQWTSLSHA